MSESNVAQDQIKAYVDRILRMKEEAKAINADIREIYAEAKGNGFDKTVLGKLVTYVEKRQTDASAVLESESLFDLYLTAYDSAAGKVGTKRATHTHASEASKVAALRADPAMAIVEAASITPKSQPSQPAGSDLASLAPHEGQVAPIQPETATSSTEQRPAEAAHVASAADHANGEAGGRTRALPEGQEGLPVEAETDKSVEASASAAPISKYADPGVVVWEHTPPEPVRRHPYSAAFGDLGQDLVVIDDDIAGANSEPIVRIGNEILDGWARYNVARGMIGGSGMSTEYPVVQYDGTDPLIDCIKWNVAGRVLSPKDKQTIVSRLSAIEPKRKADILKAVAELAI